MKKALMIIAIIAIVAIAGSMIYYFVFFRTGIAKAEIGLQEQKLELEKEKQRATEISIEKDKEDKAQQEANKEQQELNKKANLAEDLAELEKWHDDKLNQAYESFRAIWNKECERLGLKPESPLPNSTGELLKKDFYQIVEIIKENYQSKKDDIYKLYD